MSKDDLIKRANKLAADIDEYAPNTNIAHMIRELVLEVEILQRKLNEQNTESKNPAKSRKG